MKIARLVLSLLGIVSALPASARADICEAPQCVSCQGQTCFYSTCTGYCTCTPHCRPEGGCTCAGMGFCLTSPDGTFNCQNGEVRAASTIKPGTTGQCGKKADAALVKAYPWINSTTFVTRLVSRSSVSSLERLLTDLQLTVADQGLANSLHIQTGTYVGEKPAVVKSPSDVHLSELIGLTATLDVARGAYVFKVYRDVAGPGGETKYKSVQQMVVDKIAPVEVFTVTGQTYEYQGPEGKVDTGTF